MNLSNAPDHVLEALVKAALVRNPLGPVFTAMALSVNAEAHLTLEQAERWNRAIERAWTSLSDERQTGAAGYVMKPGPKSLVRRRRARGLSQTAQTSCGRFRIALRALRAMRMDRSISHPSHCRHQGS
jgi:hypothetical protein